jgi:hypothetical protein
VHDNTLLGARTFRRELPIDIVVVVKRKSLLFQVVPRLSQPRGISGVLDGRNENGEQNQDNAHNDQNVNPALPRK